MSYAHDIHLHRDFHRKAFATAVEDAITLIGHLEIELAGPSGRPDTAPILEPDRIAFNGVNYRCRCDRYDPGYHDDSRYCPDICLDRHRDSPGIVPDDLPERFRLLDYSYQPLIVDVRPRPTLRTKGEEFPAWNHGPRKDTYWFDCKTRYKPYDMAVMLAMIALKQHLGDSVLMASGAAWDSGWGYSDHFRLDAVRFYERVFPERAPVHNILR